MPELIPPGCKAGKPGAAIRKLLPKVTKFRILLTNI